MPFFVLIIVLSFSLGGFDCKENNLRSCFGTENGVILQEPEHVTHTGRVACDTLYYVFSYRSASIYINI